MAAQYHPAPLCPTAHPLRRLRTPSTVLHTPCFGVNLSLLLLLPCCHSELGNCVATGPSSATVPRTARGSTPWLPSTIRNHCVVLRTPSADCAPPPPYCTPPASELIYQFYYPAATLNLLTLSLTCGKNDGDDDGTTVSRVIYRHHQEHRYYI